MPHAQERAKGEARRHDVLGVPIFVTATTSSLPCVKWSEDPHKFGFSRHPRRNELTSALGQVGFGRQPFHVTRLQASSGFLSKREQFDYGYPATVPSAKAHGTTLAHTRGAQATQQTLVQHHFERGGDGRKVFA